MLPESIRIRCSELIGTPILNISAVGGGDINQARLLYTCSGKYFIKFNTHPAALEMFETEAAGLLLISASKVIGSPSVIGFDRIGATAFILLEHIENTTRSDHFWQRFGAALAAMHYKRQPIYGLPFNNYIGSLPQANPETEDWPSFYCLARLKAQSELAQKARKLSEEDLIHLEALYLKLTDLLPNEQPSLIHGDLWSGNFLSDAHGQGVLIDPAVCYAHREMDIAMSMLFGGFSPLFYDAYEATFPLLGGWRERIPIYQLYYLLVHVNLFGGGYVQSVRQILRRYA